MGHEIGYRWVGLIGFGVSGRRPGLSVELGSENFREKLQDYKYKGLAVLKEDSVTKHSRSTVACLLEKRKYKVLLCRIIQYQPNVEPNPFLEKESKRNPERENR